MNSFFPLQNMLKNPNTKTPELFTSQMIRLIPVMTNKPAGNEQMIIIRVIYSKLLKENSTKTQDIAKKS